MAGAFAVGGAIQRAGRARTFLAEGVDEETWIRLGGIDQWVTIRGRDLENPLLLVLHGGPGFAMGPLAHKAFAGWDAHFTVINWDQRGAGRTFGRNGKAGSGQLTIGRMVVDGIDLAEALRRRFPDRPLILLGWSWGSVLGIEMIRARPDLFAAYVGTGQVVDMQRGESLSYFGAIDRLRAQGRERGARALEAVGPPPCRRYEGPGEAAPTLLVSTNAAQGRTRRLHERLFGLAAGPRQPARRRPRLSAGHQLQPRRALAPADGLAAAGRRAGSSRSRSPSSRANLDLQVPASLVTEVLPKLRAPAVELVTLEGGAHCAIVTHADRFSDALVHRVKPRTRRPRPSRGCGGRRACRSSPWGSLSRREARSGSSRPSGAVLAGDHVDRVRTRRDHLEPSLR